MIRRKLLIFGPRVAPRPLRAGGEDVERERQAELDGGLPERVAARVVVVGFGAAATPGIITPRSPSLRISSSSRTAASTLVTAVCPRPKSRPGAPAQYSAIQRL